MQQEIIYIGFDDLPNSICKRASTLSAVNKMNYICDSINEAGYSVHLVSPSWFIEASNSIKYKKVMKSKINNFKRLTLSPSFTTSNKYVGYLKIIFSLTWLFFWLIINVRKNEKVLVYHSPWLALPILLAKKIKHFNLILEVEEIYSDVSSLHPYFDTLEKKIIQNADSFLLSTELLIEKIGKIKPYILIYGNYEIIETVAMPPNDGMTHLVYAGIIDSHKAGAFNAIETALFLPENFEIHIIGFGEVEKLLNRIEEINKISICKVHFDGLKSGVEFIKYCQSCHIGLSTQKMDGSYLNTSFPSKILTYLSLGLKVVSCNIECVRVSNIGDSVFYYENDSPEDIAKAICEINSNLDINTQNIIKKLNDNFVFELNRLFAYV